MDRGDRNLPPPWVLRAGHGLRLDHEVVIGVVERCGLTGWASGRWWGMMRIRVNMVAGAGGVGPGPGRWWMAAVVAFVGWLVPADRGLADEESDDAPARPDIVLIMSDDMGWSDVGCYGGEIPTPVLDGLAQNGLRFTQFYNTSRCCPTRASLLTGLYSHQAGVGHMMEERGLRGYRGNLNRHCRTIAEVLAPAGYRSYLSGKWHVTRHIAPDGPKHSWPLQRGFDRFYGTIHGAGSFFDPNTLTRDNTYISPYADPEYQPEEFYYTDATADHAVRFIAEHAEEHADDPFFLYVSFTAPHWPMHALEEDIERFAGMYDDGYEPVRQARLERLLELGLIDPAWEPAPLVGDWESEPDKEWQARCMEVYAAMIHSMDRAIGRIVDELERTGRLDNTLILFLHDNGGCAEEYGRQANGDGPRPDQPTLPPLADDYLQPHMRPPQTRDGFPVRSGRGVMPGAADTDLGYGEEWANVSNVPFRLYKHFVHEGGIASPLIVHWPAGIADHLRSGLVTEPSHLIDIMATAVDLTGAEYPQQVDQVEIHPLEGVSLAPSFRGERIERTAPLFWEHSGNRAIRRGDWKLVARGAGNDWQLYDMANDRTETNDLAGEHPDLVAELAAEWEAWAERAWVKPWPWDQQSRRSARVDAGRNEFAFAQGQVLNEGSPDIAGRGFDLRVRVEEPGRGVMAAQGGLTHGWSVYIDPESGAPAVALRRGGRLEVVEGEVDAVPDAPHDLALSLAGDGRLTLRLGEEVVIEADTAGPLAATPALPLAGGHDAVDPVADYPRESAFTGRLGGLQLRLHPRGSR